MEGQLRQKDDMGDALHYIDFHQLQIENKQYVTRIEERNDELLKVRISALQLGGYRCGSRMHLIYVPTSINPFGSQVHRPMRSYRPCA